METSAKISTNSISAPNNDIAVIPEQSTNMASPIIRIENILGHYKVFQDTNNIVRLCNTSNHHEPVHTVNSNRGKAIIMEQFHEHGVTLRNSELKEVIDLVTSHAVMENKPRKVYCYVAEIDGGKEYDLGDDKNTRVRVTEAGVELLESGSETLFFRSKNNRPFPFPTEHGDINLLSRYLGNINSPDQVLLIVWLAYTLAHPKISSTNYVILVLLGGQGCGKTFLSKIISALVSPSLISAQIMPKNQKDLVISAQNAHILFFDNIRRLTQQQSDDLCVMATGGHISCRQLYTDGEQFVMPLHAGIVLNGIHDFITESDLAQRSLVLRLKSMDEDHRISEKQLQSDLERDLPVIFRGLLNLIADIITHLPDAKISNSERMIDFVHWLAAKEHIDGAPPGIYQELYSDNLREGQIESLLDDVLAETLIEFSKKLKTEWEGEPKQLLIELTQIGHRFIQRSSNWPHTPTALSRRLRSLQAGLRANGVYVEFGRGQKRWIRIETNKTESRY